MPQPADELPLSHKNVNTALRVTASIKTTSIVITIYFKSQLVCVTYFELTVKSVPAPVNEDGKFNVPIVLPVP
jgi:hypothetical protein